MLKITTLILIGIILIPTLQAAENEEVVKLLLCYDSPNSDYCLAEHIFQFKGQFGEFKGQIGELKRQIGELKRQIGALKTTAKAQQQSIDAQQQTIDGQQQTIDAQQGSIQSLKDEIAHLESMHKALETTVKAQKDMIEAQQKTLQSFLNRIIHLESRLYRYTDNNDGTVTDNRTGLIWLKNANCFGRHWWKIAKKKVAKLASGQCGLRDNSRAGEWRLPTKVEWEAMMDYRYRKLTLSNAIGTGQWKEGDAFSGVQFSKYWSSSLQRKSSAWYADVYNGRIDFDDMNTNKHVWPVRGEQ
ncbi:MAG: DUF1566 domain-containing protein [Pseudomonadota bacterium]